MVLNCKPNLTLRRTPHRLSLGYRTCDVVSLTVTTTVRVMRG